MALNLRRRRSFWQRLNRGLLKQKRIKSIDKIFGDRASVNGYGEDFLMGRIGKVTNQFGMNYVAGTMANRIMRYKQYEVMDATQPFCANALDAYMSNATLPDVLTNHRAIVESEDIDLKEEIENFIYLTLNVDFNLPGWVRTLCKYGDFIIAFIIDEEGKEGIVDYIVNTMHEIDIIPKRDTKHKRIYYEYILQTEGVGMNASQFLAGPNDIATNSQNAKVLRQDEMIHFSVKGDPIFEPFGKSVFEGVRFVWSQLRLCEDAMLTYRVTRSAEKKVFKIEIGALPPDQIKQYLQQAYGEIKRVPIVDPTTGDYNLMYNVQSIMEDYVFPMRNGFGSTVESLPGGQNTDAVADVEYFKNYLRAALKVPKAYLEYDEQLSTARGLAMEDQRFAAQIKFIQSIIENELFKATVIHLLAKGYTQERISNFDIRLINPSTQEEKDRLEIIQMRSDLVTSLLSGNITSMKWNMTNIMNFDDSEIGKIESEKRQEAKIKWEIDQLSTTGTIPNPNAVGGGGEEGGEKGFETSLGGGGGGIGGGTKSMGNDALANLAGEGGGGNEEEGAENQAAPGETVDLGLGGTGVEGTAETAENTKNAGTENQPTEKPNGGTEEAEIDPLRVVSDKILDKKDLNKKNKNQENYDRGINISKSNDLIQKNTESGLEKINRILKKIKKNRI